MRYKKDNNCYKNVTGGKIMIYDNKLHKKLKTFLQRLPPRWGRISKNFLPVAEFLNKKSSGPEDIPEGDGY